MHAKDESRCHCAVHTGCIGIFYRSTGVQQRQRKLQAVTYLCVPMNRGDMLLGRGFFAHQTTIPSAYSSTSRFESGVGRYSNGKSPKNRDRRASQCPKCRSSMARVHRRPLDRLLYLGIVTQRLRCTSPTCGHEFLEKPTTRAANARPWVVGAVVGMFVLAIALSFPLYVAWEADALGPSALPEPALNRHVTSELSGGRAP